MTQERDGLTQEQIDGLTEKLQGFYEGLSQDEQWALTTIMEAAAKSAETSDVSGYGLMGKRASDLNVPPPAKLPSLPFSLFRFFPK